MSLKNVFQTVVLGLWLLTLMFWTPIKIFLSFYVLFLGGRAIYYSGDPTVDTGWALGLYSLLFFMLYWFVANYTPAKYRE